MYGQTGVLLPIFMKKSLLVRCNSPLFMSKKLISYDDGGNRLLRDFGQYLPDYMAQNSVRQPSSYSFFVSVT